MELVHLPQPAVPFLNALFHGLPPDDAQSAAMVELVEAGRRWCSFYGGYTLHDREAASIGNIAVFWSEVASALRQPSLATLLPPLCAAVPAMDEVRAERLRARFSQHAALNDLLLAGAAVSMGRAELEAVAERLPLVRQWLANVEGLLAGLAPRLHPEALAAFETCLAELGRALYQIADEASLEEGLRRARLCDDAVAELLAWDERDLRKLEESETRFGIPVVGAQLEQTLQAGHEVERGLWAPAVEGTLELVLPRLEAMWSDQRTTLLLPRDVHGDVVQHVEASLLGLREAVAGLLDLEVSAEQALERFEGALALVGEALARAREEALPTYRLEGSKATSYAEAIRGIMAGTIPDAMLLELMQESPLGVGWSEAIDALRAYLETRDTGLLLDACQVMLRLVEQQSNDAICPSCGQVLEPWGACAGCGERPISSISWEA